MAERGIRPDMILIGEPTSEARLGDIVKIGRRGSVNMWITVPGVQGHVAYPHRADNPVPEARPGDRRARGAPSRRRQRRLPALQPRDHRGRDGEQGDQRHPRLRRAPSSTSASTISSAAPTWSSWSAAPPRQAAPGATVEAKISGEAFLTPPGPIYDIVSAAIEAETGAKPQPLHPWRHLRRPLPDRALPGGRFRPAQRDHAQARRGRRGRGHPRPAAHLRAGDQSGAA